MIILLVTLPIITFLSTIAFYSMNLTTLNYEKKLVPYNLGFIVVFSYAVIYTFPPQSIEALSGAAYAYVIGVWLLGLIDDYYGNPYPKGLKGHVRYAINNRVMTTGLLKAVGTVAFAVIYLSSTLPSSFYVTLLSFFLLTGLPHVMNLFDTRPLRVWKIALIITLLIFVMSPLPSFLFVMTILAVFYVSFVLESHRKAMLGDNGATAIGAILSIVIIHHTELSIQLTVALFVFFFILFAEKVSISALVERWSVLKVIDQFGIHHNKKDT